MRNESTQPDIILASASPRRAALLRQVGLPVRIHPSRLDEASEETREGETPEAYASRLALTKARDVADRLKGVIVSSDADFDALSVPREDWRIMPQSP